MTDDQEINPYGLAMLSNYEWLSNRLEERLEINDPSTARWLAAGSVEALSWIPVSIRNLARGDESKTVEFAETLNMEPEEFKQFWEDELDSAEREGLGNFREYENLRELQTQLENFGTDPAANFKQFMAMVELGTLGMSSRVIRGVGKLGFQSAKGIPAASREVLKRLMSARSATDAVTAVSYTHLTLPTICSV